MRKKDIQMKPVKIKDGANKNKCKVAKLNIKQQPLTIYRNNKKISTKLNTIIYQIRQKSICK
jgi:hypothetical protein